MRDIKFRGLTNSGIWVYGLPIEYEYGVAITNKDSLYQVDCSEWNFGGKDIIPDTLGQYTGLKDSKGVEIYEGDIIQSVSDMVLISTNEKTGEVAINNYEVRWENERARWGRINKNGNFELLYGLRKEPLEKYYTVIGNIYENPELLGKQ